MITRINVAGRILRHAVASGFADYSVMYTPLTWTFGWMARVLCQVTFFALIGRLLGSDEVTRYLLVGNAVMFVVIEACFVNASTTWERRAGTLPLLVAAPVNPLTVFFGRSLFWLVTGTTSSSLALFILAPVFGVNLSWPSALLAVPLILVVGFSAYCCAIMFAGIVLRFMHLRNVAGNVINLSVMAFCGVQVPRQFWPEAVQWITAFLPVSHGLQAIRDLLDGAAASTILAGVALELAVAGGWLVLAALTFRHLAEGGRKNGSIEFAD